MTDHLELTFHEVTTRNGLFCQFDDHHGVLLLDVKNPFTLDDFRTIASIIDPFFEANGELAGIIINAKKFPHWKSPRNRQEYQSFAMQNHRKFKKAALGMGGILTRIIVGFVKKHAYPEIKMFKYNEIEKAQSWVLKI